MSKKKDSKDTLYCSFCTKSQGEVKKLIAGPMVFICDECVLLCIDILKTEGLIGTEIAGEELQHRDFKDAAQAMARTASYLLQKERERHRPYEELERQVGAFQQIPVPTVRRSGTSDVPATVTEISKESSSTKS